MALLAGALVVLVVDTFMSDRQRNVTYALAIGVLTLVAGSAARSCPMTRSSMRSAACTSPIP